ncbi:MAG: AraC family transcriptional regulator [Pseudomonadota bacterium]
MGTYAAVSDILLAAKIDSIRHGAEVDRWRTESFHALEEHCLYWFNQGQGQMNVAGSGFFCPANTVVFVPAGATHALSLWPNAIVKRVKIRDLPQIPMPNKPAKIELWDVREQASYVVIFDGLARELENTSEGIGQAVLGYAHLFAAWLMREVGRSAQMEETAAAALVRRYCDLLEIRYTDGVTIAELAAELGVTPTHLSRCCRRCCGMSAHEVLSSRLMYEARDLLAKTTVPINRISIDLGYSSPAYFTRAFQAVTGLTPSSFRKEAARA